MKLRSVLIVIACSAGLTACGARSTTDNSIGGGGGGSRTQPPADDATTRPTDGATPPPVDSCLTIPASEVQGRYVGTFEGNVSCTPGPVSGTVEFALTGVGAEVFSINGELTGHIDSIGAAIYSEILGTMNCTTFTGKLELFVSESEAFTGQMTGEYSRLGFPSGRWSVKNRSLNCQGSGSWEAKRR